ncbi:MAG TPA: hypothetical protein VF469_32035 [Kofleriaceae bacterium]
MNDLLRKQQTALHTLAERKRDYAGWTEACALLDEVPDDIVRAHLEELEAALGTWPPEVRIAPLHWAARLHVEGQEPRVQLCRVLGLSNLDNRNDLWRALDSPDVARIDVLGIAYCDLDQAAAPELARRLAQIRVRRLELTGNDIGAGIVHILKLSRDGVLTSLSAESCGLGGGTLEAVVASGAIIGLREFELGLNYLAARDLEYLSRLPGLDGLHRLGLARNKFLAAGARILAEQAPLHALRELDMEGTQCGTEGAAALASARALGRLEKLSLMGCLVGDIGAASLAAATPLGTLRELDLRFNRITAVGARSLLASTALNALTRLYLDHNEIDDDIVDALAGCPQVARLALLTLDDSHLSDKGRSALQEFPLRPGMLEVLLLREDG